MARYVPLPERFWAKVEKTESCWIWTACRNARGYGMINVRTEDKGRRPLLAHRVAWFLTHGEWPTLLDHFVCDNPPCVNPSHLRPSTKRENTLRGTAPTALNAKKTHCPRGHAYEGDNLMRYGHGRFCRECARIRRRERTERERSARAAA